MKNHPVFYLIIGVFVLIVPTTIYLCFLVPKLSEAYNVLMASAGVIGGAGMYGASKIPEKIVPPAIPAVILDEIPASNNASAKIIDAAFPRSGVNMEPAK